MGSQYMTNSYGDRHHTSELFGRWPYSVATSRNVTFFLWGALASISPKTAFFSGRFLSLSHSTMSTYSRPKKLSVWQVRKHSACVTSLSLLCTRRLVFSIWPRTMALPYASHIKRI